MALKKLTFNEERIRAIKSIKNTLKNFSFPYDNKTSRNIEDFIYYFASISVFYSTNLEECVEQVYGSSDNKNNDVEWELATLLFNFAIIRELNPECHNIGTANNENHKELILENTKNIIKDFFPEYEIDWEAKRGEFISFKSKSTKTIIDNLSDVDKEIANPIKELLMPLKSDIELRGLISEVYGGLEKINIKKYDPIKNDKNETISLLKNTIKLAKQLVNDNKNKAKGHIGHVDLKITDIAHNFALLSALSNKIVKQLEDYLIEEQNE